MNACVDFRLHEIVRVRLVNAGETDVAAVQRHLGPVRAPVAGDADILIHFQDEGPDPTEMRILGDWEAAYSEDAFWLLEGKNGQPIAVQLPLDQVGGPCRIVCRRPLAAIPLLIPIVNLTALVKGFLPLHASAFLYQGQTGLVTGWAKGGKTEALLGFAEQDATYVGDEWVYIDPAASTLYGLPTPIQLWDWHLEASPFRRQLRRKERLKLAVLRQLARPLDRWHDRVPPPGKLLCQLAEFVRGRRKVCLPPQRLFGDRIQPIAACPATVFFMASHAAPEIDVRAIEINEIINRMAYSLTEEFSELTDKYRQFRFAFPERANPWLEDLPLRLHARLRQVFHDKTGRAVWHPYPVAPHALFHAMRPYFQRAATSRKDEVAEPLCEPIA